MKKTVLVVSEDIRRLAEILTGYGQIMNIDHEGTITYEIDYPEIDDPFELGRQVSEIEGELRAYDGGVKILSSEPRTASRAPKTTRRKHSPLPASKARR